MIFKYDFLSFFFLNRNKRRIDIMKISNYGKKSLGTMNRRVVSVATIFHTSLIEEEKLTTKILNKWNGRLESTISMRNLKKRILCWKVRMSRFWITAKDLTWSLSWKVCLKIISCIFRRNFDIITFYISRVYLFFLNKFSRTRLIYLCTIFERFVEYLWKLKLLKL